MKRKHAPRRRDRKTGESPYAKHGKREYAYSANYREWHNAHRMGGAKQRHGEQAHHG